MLSRGYNIAKDSELFYCGYILELVINFDILFLCDLLL
jgi:hypothetical protein